MHTNLSLYGNKSTEKHKHFHSLDDNGFFYVDAGLLNEEGDEIPEKHDSYGMIGFSRYSSSQKVSLSDHATGEIIEYGLKMGIPICIVPCCALGKFSNNIERRSYAQWMNLLRQKLPNYKITDLPIRGRNKIIWT